MRSPALRWTFLLAWAVPSFAASCQPVEGGSILARDFAPQVPAFSALQPATAILAAPFSGVRRIVTAEEVSRLARKFSLAVERPPPSMCFEQATVVLTSDDFLPVFRAAFPARDTSNKDPSNKDAAHEVKIEILEFTSTPVPRGPLQFTRAGLEPSGLWHGRVVYGEGRSVSVWARVRVMEERTWVEAAEMLPAGKPIRADQLVLRTGLRSSLDPAPPEALESVIGKKPLRLFAPGAALRPQLLIEPPQVERGDKVSVQVSKGGAFLQFEAEAESPGHNGDLVFLRNPGNGSRFQAKVEGKGKVAIRK